MKALDAEYNKYMARRQFTDDELYDRYLASTRKEIKKEFDLKSKYSTKPFNDKLVSSIYKQYSKSQYKQVIAVLVNDYCFSACREMTIALKALPNTVFIGSEIYLKHAQASGYETHRYKDVIEFAVSRIPVANDKY